MKEFGNLENIKIFGNGFDSIENLEIIWKFGKHLEIWKNFRNFQKFRKFGNWEILFGSIEKKLEI